MAAEIITTDDLHTFKIELLDEFKKLLETAGSKQPKKWLRSSEVRKLLGISPGTLQNLRVNTIPYTKIGGIIYYSYDDIKQLLETNK